MATRVKTVTVKGKSHAFEALTRPDALAVALGISGKQLRGYLRSRYALGSADRNAMQPGGKASSWTLTRDAIAGAIKHYAPPKA
jgi:hypothetical protein